MFAKEGLAVPAGYVRIGTVQNDDLNKPQIKREMEILAELLYDIWVWKQTGELPGEKARKIKKRKDYLTPA